MTIRNWNEKRRSKKRSQLYPVLSALTAMANPDLMEVIRKVEKDFALLRDGGHGNDVNFSIYNRFRNCPIVSIFTQDEFDTQLIDNRRQRSMPRPSQRPSAVFMANGGISITATNSLSGGMLVVLRGKCAGQPRDNQKRDDTDNSVESQSFIYSYAEHHRFWLVGLFL